MRLLVDIALDTLAASARVLLLVPGYEPLR